MKKINKKKKRNKIIKIIFIVFFIMLTIYYGYSFCFKSTKKVFNTSKYQIIKQDYNSNYDGIGQKNVKNKDGYFTTFTTISRNQKTYKEYKQNGDSSWANNPYWSGTMSDNGCGITALSIILSGYGYNFTPEDFRNTYYPHLDSNEIPTLFSNKYNISSSGFYYDNIHLSKKELEKHLLTNRPILICVWNKPDKNRWTTASHYMVMLATDGKGMVYISNPNGGENAHNSSGWYDFEEVTPYIAKALYIDSY